MTLTQDVASPVTLPEGQVLSPPYSLAPGIRASLMAKLERLLSRPIIARIDSPSESAEQDQDPAAPMAFRALATASRALEPKRVEPWTEDSLDGTCAVRIAIDYDEVWRGCEKEIREAFEKLFALECKIDGGGDEIVFFADEAGDWQFGTVWSIVLRAWFVERSPSAPLARECAPSTVAPQRNCPQR